MNAFKRYLTLTILAIFTLPAFLSPAGDEGEENPKLNIVIVFPGGLTGKKEVKKAIGQLSDVIAKEASLKPGAVSGHYFTTTDKTVAFLNKKPDSFIIGSLGFFLAQRKAFGLVPLAKVDLAEGPNRRYYLVAKKGKYRNWKDLKGKTVSGNILYEDPAFLEKIVFNNHSDLISSFILKPTSRPLSALRKVTRDQLDAALLNEAQYRSLERLPLSDQLEVIYRSPQLPEVGLMMVDTPDNRKAKDRLLEALAGLGRTESGASTFQSFGVRGFTPISPDSLNNVIRKYEQGP